LDPGSLLYMYKVSIPDSGGGIPSDITSLDNYRYTNLLSLHTYITSVGF